jgi:hypothetical protein
MIYKTLQRKLKIEQHEPHKKSGVNSVRCSGRLRSSKIAQIYQLRITPSILVVNSTHSCQQRMIHMLSKQDINTTHCKQKVVN